MNIRVVAALLLAATSLAARAYEEPTHEVLTDAAVSVD